MTPINTDDEKPFLKYKMQLRESDRRGAPPYIYDHFLVPWAGHLNGSLVFAVVFPHLGWDNDSPLQEENIH